MIDTAYVYQPAVSDRADRIQGVLSEAKSIGIDSIILSEARRRGDDGTYHWVFDPDLIGLWLYEAFQQAMGVYVGLVSTGPEIVNHREPYITEDAAETAMIVAHVVDHWGGTHGALRGFSVSSEPALAYHTDPAILAELHAYYRAQVDAVRQSSPLPVLCAPYLGGVYTAWDGSVQTPEQVATKAVAFRDATGTIQVWQDSCGTEPTPVFQQPRQQYHLADYYRAISEAVGGDAWSNTELGTWGRPLFEGPGYHAGPMARIAHSINAAAGMGRRATWLQPHHMGTVLPDHKPDSPRLLAAYRAFYEFEGEYVWPFDYDWLTPPSTRDGFRLADLVTGDPRDPTDPAWVVIDGTARVIVDLREPKDLRWVGAHVMHNAVEGIALPDSIRIDTSTNRKSWTKRGTWPLAVNKSDGEYVIANAEPLGITARYLRVTLANTAKTYVSELEVIA